MKTTFFSFFFFFFFFLTLGWREHGGPRLEEKGKKIRLKKEKN